MSAAVASGGSSFHSLMVLGRIENCPVFAIVVVFGVAGRGIDVDDLGAAAVCWQALQCGPGRSLSFPSW